MPACRCRRRLSQTNVCERWRPLNTLISDEFDPGDVGCSSDLAVDLAIFWNLGSLRGEFRLSGRTSGFEPQESLHVVNQVGETDLGLGSSDADGAHEQPHAVLLVAEDVLDLRTDL